MFLTAPDAAYAHSYIDFCIAYKQDNLHGYTNDYTVDALERMRDENGAGALLAALNDARLAAPTDVLVPCSQFWLICDGEVAGVGNIRHCLTPALEFFGGHVGYGVRLGRWNKGIGTALLRGLIRQAQALGIHTLLLTCADNNAASQRVMQKNGATLLDKVMQSVDGETRLGRRYLIDTGLARDSAFPLRNHALLYQAEAAPEQARLTLMPSKAVDEGGRIISYYFDIRLADESAGWIVCRVGDEGSLYYDGNIGYYIHPTHRGRGLAYDACLLMGAKLKRLGVDRAVITCDSDNAPSRRVCQKLGATFLEIARPNGKKIKCRYIWRF